MTYAIGLDLGGSSIKAVSISPAGQARAESNLSFNADEKLDWGHKIRQLLDEIQQRLERPASHIGLSAPGLASADGRSIAFMPGRLHGLEGLDWTAFLQSPHPVPVLNDAHAALLGEAWIGAARKTTNAIMLTLGTGVGGAAIVDGHLLRGAIGRAGHLGHSSLDPLGIPDICGTPGSLETAIGNYRIQERSNGRFASTHQLIQAHTAGDPLATEIWSASVRALAAAVASFINILDPEVVVIGGGIARAGDALFVPLREHLETMEWRPGGHRARIAAAELGEFAGAIGAAHNALTLAGIPTQRGRWRVDLVPYLRPAA